MLLKSGSPAELLEDLGTAATCLISFHRIIMVDSSVSVLVRVHLRSGK